MKHLFWNINKIHENKSTNNRFKYLPFIIPFSNNESMINGSFGHENKKQYLGL